MFVLYCKVTRDYVVQTLTLIALRRRYTFGILKKNIWFENTLVRNKENMSLGLVLADLAKVSLSAEVKVGSL